MHSCFLLETLVCVYFYYSRGLRTGMSYIHFICQLFRRDNKKQMTDEKTKLTFKTLTNESPCSQLKLNDVVFKVISHLCFGMSDLQVDKDILLDKNIHTIARGP